MTYRFDPLLANSVDIIPPRECKHWVGLYRVNLQETATHLQRNVESPLSWKTTGSPTLGKVSTWPSILRNWTCDDLWLSESTRLGLSFKLPAGNNADVLSDPWAWRANPSSLAWCPLPRYELLRPWLGAGVTVGLSFWAKEELARQPLLPTVLWSSTPTIVLTQWKCMEMFHWWYFQMFCHIKNWDFTLPCLITGRYFNRIPLYPRSRPFSQKLWLAIIQHSLVSTSTKPLGTKLGHGTRSCNIISWISIGKPPGSSRVPRHSRAQALHRFKDALPFGLRGLQLGEVFVHTLLARTTRPATCPENELWNVMNMWKTNAEFVVPCRESWDPLQGITTFWERTLRQHINHGSHNDVLFLFPNEFQMIQNVRANFINTYLDLDSYYTTCIYNYIYQCVCVRLCVLRPVYLAIYIYLSSNSSILSSPAPVQHSA